MRKIGWEKTDFFSSKRKSRNMRVYLSPLAGECVSFEEKNTMRCNHSRWKKIHTIQLANQPIDSFASKLMLSTQINYELRPSTNDSSHFLIISDRLGCVVLCCVFFILFSFGLKRQHWEMERKRGYKQAIIQKWTCSHRDLSSASSGIIHTHT